MKLKELFENMGLRLKDACEVSTNLADADFWLQRKGSTQTVGTVLKEFSPENIGIKVIRTDISAFGEQHQATTTSCCGCL